MPRHPLNIRNRRAEALFEDRLTNKLGTVTSKEGKKERTHCLCWVDYLGTCNSDEKGEREGAPTVVLKSIRRAWRGGAFCFSLLCVLRSGYCRRKDADTIHGAVRNPYATRIDATNGSRAPRDTNPGALIAMDRASIDGRRAACQHGDAAARQLPGDRCSEDLSAAPATVDVHTALRVLRHIAPLDKGGCTFSDVDAVVRHLPLQRSLCDPYVAARTGDEHSALPIVGNRTPLDDGSPTRRDVYTMEFNLTMNLE